jgi:hypothetical protein
VDVSPDPRHGPELSVEVASCVGPTEPGHWDIAWAVGNLNPDPIRVANAWLPHGKFRSPRKDFEPPIEIAPAAVANMEFSVLAREEPGTVVENCFVILSLTHENDDWRVFARLRVTFEDAGKPRAETVLITRQRVGFSA